MWSVGLFGSDVGAFMSTNLLIPAGLSSLGIKAALYLDARDGDSLDFGHTGIFRFGDLATGLSFTSESGTFLSDLAVTGGGVPEPATWAMMIAGFGLTGVAIRRRRASIAA